MGTCLEITAEKSRVPLGKSLVSRSPHRPPLFGERFFLPPSHTSITQGPVNLSQHQVAHQCVEHMFGQIQSLTHPFSSKPALDIPPLHHQGACTIAGDGAFPATGRCAHVTTRLCYRLFDDQALGITELHWFPGQS